MSMTDVYAAQGTLSDRHSLARDLVAAEDSPTRGCHDLL